MTGIALGYLENCKAGDEVWIQSSSRRRIRSEVKDATFRLNAIFTLEQQ